MTRLRIFLFSVSLDVLIFLTCCRAMLEDGDPLDTSPQLLAGLILEGLGDVEEAAVRRAFTFVSPQRAICGNIS